MIEDPKHKPVEVGAMKRVDGGQGRRKSSQPPGELSAVSDIVGCVEPESSSRLGDVAQVLFDFFAGSGPLCVTFAEACRSSNTCSLPTIRSSPLICAVMAVSRHATSRPGPMGKSPVTSHPRRVHGRLAVRLKRCRPIVWARPRPSPQACHRVHQARPHRSMSVCGGGERLIINDASNISASLDCTGLSI